MCILHIYMYVYICNFYVVQAFGVYFVPLATYANIYIYIYTFLIYFRNELWLGTKKNISRHPCNISHLFVLLRSSTAVSLLRGGLANRPKENNFSMF